MKTLNIKKVNTVEDAKAFIQWSEINIGGGFHPDTPFADYVKQDDSPTFTPDEVTMLQPLLDACFKLMGDNVYDYALDLFFTLNNDFKI